MLALIKKYKIFTGMAIVVIMYTSSITVYALLSARYCADIICHSFVVGDYFKYFVLIHKENLFDTLAEASDNFYNYDDRCMYILDYLNRDGINIEAHLKSILSKTDDTYHKISIIGMLASILPKDDASYYDHCIMKIMSGLGQGTYSGKSGDGRIADACVWYAGISGNTAFLPLVEQLVLRYHPHYNIMTRGIDAISRMDSKNGVKSLEKFRNILDGTDTYLKRRIEDAICKLEQNAETSHAIEP